MRIDVLNVLQDYTLYHDNTKRVASLGLKGNGKK